MQKINVLSLFWGMECGAIALKKMWVEVGNYYSSEVDKYPIQNSTHNFPNIIHLGSVTGIEYEDGALFHNQDNDPMVNGWSYIDAIDWLIGGSPCQDVSNAGAQKWLAENYKEYLIRKSEWTATRSDLVWEFIRILHEVKPKYFMLENVKMKKDLMAIFNRAIGFEALSLNSALVSAQSRKRIYFCWQRNEDGTYSQVHIEQPEDRGLLLKDVLEDIPFDSPMWKELPEKYVSVVKERTKTHALTTTYAWVCPKNYFEKGQRQLVVTNINPSGNWMNGNIFFDGAKSPTITTNKGEGNKILGVLNPFNRSDIRIHAERNKVCTLTANMGTGGHKIPKQGTLEDPSEFYFLELWGDLKYYWRKLTITECARLQGIPDWYKFIVSNSRAYKMIGNGWQVDTIEYIFSHFNLCGK